eukprot:scaffold27681_cov29-Phaeocystis_antarctica.AAC.2
MTRPQATACGWGRSTRACGTGPPRTYAQSSQTTSHTWVCAATRRAAWLGGYQRRASFRSLAAAERSAPQTSSPAAHPRSQGTVSTAWLAAEARRGGGSRLASTFFGGPNKATRRFGKTRRG